MEKQALKTEKKIQEVFEMANASTDEFCPIRDVIARLSDKWTLLTIYALGGYGVLRFNELKKKISDVSQRMLTVTLRNLEVDGLVKRTVYPEVPPRVEYELTEIGHSLLVEIENLSGWADANGAKIMASRNKKKGSPN